ncbi:bifunctional DNA-formamidopyrimidine glycosylase/DNA-(apurinic or apyrimidinic site) lyase [Jannaschia sp. S6380]|uniref:bifunctional DNA-formamidopyrimidine glycosylase/DNA-(apurinic or apyrimidinic site) lyase n=1 Tax=Jannaschia sp. S6380 TaxID=2926408 RepID=UPI001FF300C5|nr:bifunctional DNA-formamidopyrimidine glycosylase/DNA-(apurinic or apyrimidinic site) lyase [Jannaschia sp. S6380]MCK0168877.1 bifunctional DNA-formamidopyrimidine glycosylase/DNA-(apurinic or apyrimidinic site) lyase [Jannaschia sp. S6380]
MPELPEVETVRRGLAPALEGARLVRVEVNRPDLRWPFPARMAARLEGATIRALGRRSKYLLAHLDTGETLIVHLGMSGRMVVDALRPGRFHREAGWLARHDHVVLHTAAHRVTFNDARRFGAMDLCPTDALDDHWLIAKLGPEPLGNGFHAAHLTTAFRGRRTPVKAALLDQRIVAGLGNIYVNEALHRAGIAPTRAAGRIAAVRVAGLVPIIRDVLLEAIKAGGSSLRDHRRADGELGYFQHTFRVYDREGAPCPTPGCAGTIRRIMQSGRSTFHCPACQR